MGPAQRLTIALFAIAVGLRLFRPGLHSLDDCFYARKAVEMLREGSWITVFWGGAPTWQNPPLQFDLIGIAFRLFGVHDASARIPQYLMAVALLPITAFIARRLKMTETAQMLAVGVLATTPVLIANATRVMLDVPAAFWCSATIASAISLRPEDQGGGVLWKRLLGASCLCVSIAGAILTKSLLGLLGLAILGGAWAISPSERPLRLMGFAAVSLGLLLGSVWYAHEYWRFGHAFVDQHFLGEIYRRSTSTISWLDRLAEYPILLLRDFEPWILPGLLGVLVIARTRSLRSGPMALVAAWILAPLVLLSLSSVRRVSYLYPTIPGIALAAAFWLDRFWPRAAPFLGRRVIPILLMLLATVNLVRPQWIGRSRNAGMIAAAPVFRTMVPEGRTIPSHEVSYWRVANPLLYYADRLLAKPVGLEAALSAAHRADRVLVVGPGVLPTLRERVPGAEELARDRDWVLVRVPYH